MFWWVELDLVPLMYRTMSIGVFCGVCELSMTFSNLSANGWSCVPVLLVVLHEASCAGVCWPLSGAGSCC